MKLQGRKLIVYAGTLIAGWLGTSAQAQSQASVGKLDLTLDRAIEIALAENPSIKVADKDIELKKVADKEAWQKLLPTVDGQFSLSHSVKVAKMRISMSPEPIAMGVDGSTSAVGNIVVNMPLYAPSVYQNMKLTKEDIELAVEQARGSRLDLVNQVTKAYYGALLSSDSYEVVKRSYATAKANFDIVNDKYKVGKVSEYDKISAEVQMRNTNSSMVSAETGKKLALLRLKVLMGVTADVDIHINDSLKAYENNLTLPEEVNDLKDNTDLRQLDQNMKLLERTRKILHTNFMPTLGFQATGTYQSMSNKDWNLFKYEYFPGVTIAFSLNVPIYHADNWTKLKTNKIKMAQLTDKRNDVEKKLKMSAESYRQNMASTIAQVTSNREAVRLADKGVAISSKRYDVGRGTILELNQSEDALTMSELTYVQSIHDYLSNKADLDYTLGRENYIK